jgi:hypothetical protein
MPTNQGQRTKKSKLLEKPTRVPSVQLERKAHAIRDYVAHLSQRPDLSEYARGVAFVQLLKDLLIDADPQFLQDYLAGMEHPLAGPKTALYNRGRVDALYGNLIIEFKRSLSKSLSEAEEQIKKYLALLYCNPEERVRPFIGMATDGIQFVTYAPRLKPDVAQPTPGDVQLVEIEKANFDSLSPEEAYYWLDRYFVRKTGLLAPRTESIVNDFGPSSGSFIHAMNVLDGVWKHVADDTESQVFYQSWQKYLRITYGALIAEQELFLRHTYLATLAKIMVWIRLTGATEPPMEPELRSILNGHYFGQRGIQNFLEEDFFAWLARDAAWPQTQTLGRRLLLQLATYNLRELSEDVMKGLYEKLVDPKDRHDLGEYYTPDWLAAMIVRERLKENPRASVLDPACGSGTFLYQTILYKREHLGDSVKTLKHIEESVVGIDIHPLAVIVAKTIYLLGLGDLLQHRTVRIRIPVYLADSIKPPVQHVRQKRGDHETRQMTFGTYGVTLNGDVVNLPEDLALDDQLYDSAIELCREYAESTADRPLPTKDELANFLKRSQTNLARSAFWVDSLYELFQILRKKIRERKDTIWAFVLKNVFKPLLLKSKFDILVGNPPWLTYKDIERGEYQSYLKDLIVHEYKLCSSKLGFLTQLELGTLFFVRSADFYLKSEGGIGFVLPRSIFSADQHAHLRSSSYRHPLNMEEIWDLENVTPLFRVPSCVILACKDAQKQGARVGQIAGRVLSGVLSKKNASLEEAEGALKAEKKTLWVVKRGKRTHLSLEREEPSGEHSPYLSKFIQGAVIYPRSLWFVHLLSNSKFGIDTRKPLVETAPDAVKKAKKPYQDLKMSGTVEAEFLYGTLLSTDLIPFGFSRLRMVVLPILRDSPRLRLLKSEDARRDGFLGLADWLATAEEYWAAIRGDKAQKEGGVTERLDYIHQLTKQQRKTFSVVYPGSATNLCATVFQNNRQYVDAFSPSVPLVQFIAHGETYYCDTDDEEEAVYLSAFLNSSFVNARLKPMQARGLFGPRHIHKKPLEMPIPAFGSSEELHKSLAELGRQCHVETQQFVAQLTDREKFGSVGKLRGLVRQRLSGHLSQIDEIVKILLSV